MKFPAPNNPTVANLPIILINWAFGLGVIQYPIGRRRPIISGFWSMTHFLVYLNFVRMANLPELTHFQGSTMIANIYCVTIYCCVVYIAISMCLAHFSSKAAQRYITNIIDINVRLKAMGIPNDYELTFKSQIIHICVAFGWIFTAAALDFGGFSADFDSETSKRFGFLMTSYYLLVFVFVVDCGFVTHIRYFGNRFHRLNALLIESDSPERSKTTLTQSDDKFCNYFSVIHEIHGNNLPSIRAANKQWILHVIRETRKIHQGLRKMAREWNKACGFQLLFSVALTFFLITTFLYMVYILGTLKNWTDDNYVGTIITLMWIIFFATKVLVIVDACATTSSEANWTGELITNFLNTRVCDEDIRDEIDIFSLQLLQNPLNFTASEFFTLDYSLVRGIIGSVTTYLVIMIQMRSTYDSKT